MMNNEKGILGKQLFIEMEFDLNIFRFHIIMFITKGSSRGATLSFTLRSKGEGGQPRYLILQEIASHFSTPPLHTSHAP